MFICIKSEKERERAREREREKQKEEKCSVRFSDCFSRHDRRKGRADTEAKYGVRSKWITAPHRPISLSIYQTDGPPVFIYI